VAVAELEAEFEGAEVAPPAVALGVGALRCEIQTSAFLPSEIVMSLNCQLAALSKGDCVGGVAVAEVRVIEIGLREGM
jgi:hypothetical protein